MPSSRKFSKRVRRNLLRPLKKQNGKEDREPVAEKGGGDGSDLDHGASLSSLPEVHPSILGIFKFRTTRHRTQQSKVDMSWYLPWLAQQIAKMPPIMTRFITADLGHEGPVNLSLGSKFYRIFMIVNATVSGAKFIREPHVHPLGFSIDALIGQLDTFLLIPHPPLDSERFYLARTLVFAILGWQSMLYSPSLPTTIGREHRYQPPANRFTYNDLSSPDHAASGDGPWVHNQRNNDLPNSPQRPNHDSYNARRTQRTRLDAFPLPTYNARPNSPHGPYYDPYNARMSQRIPPDEPPLPTYNSRLSPWNPPIAPSGDPSRAYDFPYTQDEPPLLGARSVYTQGYAVERGHASEPSLQGDSSSPVRSLGSTTPPSPQADPPSPARLTGAVTPPPPPQTFLVSPAVPLVAAPSPVSPESDQLSREPSPRAVPAPDRAERRFHDSCSTADPTPGTARSGSRSPSRSSSRAPPIATVGSNPPSPDQASRSVRRSDLLDILLPISSSSSASGDPTVIPVVLAGRRRQRRPPSTIRDLTRSPGGTSYAHYEPWTRPPEGHQPLPYHYAAHNPYATYNEDHAPSSGAEGKKTLALNNDGPNSDLVFDRFSVPAHSAGLPLPVFLRSFGCLLPPRSIESIQLATEARRATSTSTPINPSEMNAHFLDVVLQIKIRWVDTLATHLDFHRSSRTLSLFRYPSLCVAMLHSEGALFGFADDEIKPKRARTHDESVADHAAISELLYETLHSYRLLFGQNKSSRNLFRRLYKSTPGLNQHPDPLLQYLCTAKEVHHCCVPYDRVTYYVQRNFGVLGVRVENIARELKGARPNSWKALLRDRRDTVQYWTFWLVAIIGCAGLLLSLAQVILQALSMGK
ncbi:MAG: hypothetical protein M4579_002595 [Chaenotheca gracillima]|nr:MAG: hypothetical protein M4579_002595 [Chaenotheca gracillima]